MELNEKNSVENGEREQETSKEVDRRTEEGTECEQRTVGAGL